MGVSWSVGEKGSHARAQRVMGGVPMGEDPRSVPSGSRTTPAISSRSRSSAELTSALGAYPFVTELFALIVNAQPTPSQTKCCAGLIVVTTLISAGVAIGVGSGLPLLLILAVCVAILAWLRRASFLRAERFERDYPSMLVALASSVRTGLDPIVALEQASGLFSRDSELGRELREFSDAVQRGDGEEAAIRDFGATIDHPDIPLFRAAFLLARKEGSSLSKCLHRLAKVTRNRQSFRRRMRAAVAMQKLSSLGIAGCAVLIVCFQAVVNNKALVVAAAHPLGVRMLIAAGVLMGAGLIGMLRMCRARL